MGLVRRWPVTHSNLLVRHILHAAEDVQCGKVRRLNDGVVALDMLCEANTISVHAVRPPHLVAQDRNLGIACRTGLTLNNVVRPRARCGAGAPEGHVEDTYLAVGTVHG